MTYWTNRQKPLKKCPRCLLSTYFKEQATRDGNKTLALNVRTVRLIIIIIIIRARGWKTMKWCYSSIFERRDEIMIRPLKNIKSIWKFGNTTWNRTQRGESDVTALYTIKAQEWRCWSVSYTFSNSNRKLDSKFFWKSTKGVIRNVLVGCW